MRLQSIDGRAVVLVMARNGRHEELSELAKRHFDTVLPETPLLARGSPVSFVWNGHRQWLAMADEAAVSDFMGLLSAKFGATASLSDQSDGRCVLTLAGPAARDALAKLAPIDLHPREFRPGQTVLTMFGHVPCQITQIDETPTYELIVSRSLADSFLDSLLEAGAAFGIDVVSNSDRSR
ncbi:MAG: sarcosine oxidase subunit gamma [Candidatus Binataceae bacterium]